MSTERQTDPATLDKNRLYDTVASEIWRLAVYEPVHDGWEFTNVAGAEFLDAVAEVCRLRPESHLLELCSGTGAVSRYLSRRTGCAVTGVELNEVQIVHARRARAQAGPDAARVSFVHNDVTRWQPDRLYDVALAVDSLALLAEPVLALRTARRALRSDGWFAFADTVAGPQLSTATAQRAWDLDGLRPLPGPDGTAELLEAAGLTEVRMTDATDVAVHCFQTIADALRERETEIRAVTTAEELAEWHESTDFYLRGYRTGELTYWRGTARRPRRA